MGATRVWVSSRLKPEVGDSGWIVVGQPVPVASVRFLKDSLVLFLGGAPESLAVEVLPQAANQEVSFSLDDTTKATLAGAFLTAKAAGGFTVRVRSREDTTKSDVLPVVVREPVRVSAVVAEEEAVTLYLGGPARRLAAQVLPATAPQGVRWRSQSPTIVSADPVTGQVTPLRPGLALVEAISQADTTARDTVAVTAKLDVPRVIIAADSVVSAGAQVPISISVTQEFGLPTLLKWDLDGDQAWDDSAAGTWTGPDYAWSPLFRRFDKPGPVTLRVQVRDSEGNTGEGSRTIRVVGAAAVTIVSPAHNSHTNQRTIPVAWSVNGVPQDSLLTETLAAAGPNWIKRSARDSAGTLRADSVIVHLDTVAPLKPVLSGASPTNQKPRWTWSTGGGGSGDYRFRLGDSDFPADAPTTRDTTHTLAADPVSGTTYTLYVQERDPAGNWSPVASLAIRYDVSRPVVVITSPQASGAWTIASLPLQEGSPATVTVIAIDQAGNTGEASLILHLDATPPAAPTITTSPAAAIAAAKGTFGWAAGTDGTAGSGLNGRCRFRLNGGAWKDTTATLLIDLPLAEGNNVFEVQEQDRASLWSTSATRVVRVDTSGPVITLTGQNPRNSATMAVTLSGTVRDSAGGIAMTVSGQVAGSSSVTVTGTSWTTASLTLASGANTLTIAAADQLGNDRTLSVVVNVNVPAPSVVITNPSDSLTVTNQSSLVVSYRIDGGAVQTQTFTLATDGVHRLVVSSPPNASDNIGRDTVKVTRDATQPLSPTATRGTTPTNGNAIWTWVSRGDNAGGAGMRSPALYRFSMNGGTTWTETNTARHELNAADGSYTLVAQEQDRAGNWSPSSAPQTIVVDKTGPTVVITTRNNYVTSASSTVIRYRVDNGAENSRTCALVNGSNTCSASASDGLNTTTASITVWRRENVVFFTTTGAGSETGTDWENAMETGTIPSALENSAAYSGKEFWVGTGNFEEMRLDVRFPLSIIAGFNPATFPHTTANRTRGGTRFGYFQVYGATGVRMDGAAVTAFGAGGSSTSSTVLTDVDIDPPGQGPRYTAIYLVDNTATLTANNIRITEKSFSNTIIFVSGGTLNLNGGSVTRNSSSQNPILVGGTVNLSGGFTASGNNVSDLGNYGTYQYRVSGGGRLTAASGTSVNCNAVVVEQGGTSPRN